MRERLQRLVAHTFQLSPEEVPADAATGSVPRWDSLGHLELMLALETEFAVHVSTEEMLELTTLEAIEDFLRSRSGGRVSA